MDRATLSLTAIGWLHHHGLLWHHVGLVLRHAAVHSRATSFFKCLGLSLLLLDDFDGDFNNTLVISYELVVGNRDTGLVFDRDFEIVEGRGHSLPEIKFFFWDFFEVTVVELLDAQSSWEVDIKFNSFLLSRSNIDFLLSILLVKELKQPGLNLRRIPHFLKVSQEKLNANKLHRLRTLRIVAIKLEKHFLSYHDISIFQRDCEHGRLLRQTHKAPAHVFIDLLSHRDRVRNFGFG